MAYFLGGKKGGGVPGWAWVLIAIAVIYFVGVQTSYLIQNRASTSNVGWVPPVFQGVLLQQTTQTIYQPQTSWQTTTQIVSSSSSQTSSTSSSAASSSPAWCQLALPTSDIQAGGSLGGQVTGNIPNAQVAVYRRLVGEPVDPNVVYSTTDAQGNTPILLGSIQLPGVYQFLAKIGQLACGAPDLAVTVHGLAIRVEPHSVMSGSPVTINVYSGTPTHTVEIQYRLSTDPVWITLTSQSTNLGGHYAMSANTPAAMGYYIYRAYDRPNGILSNEETVWAGL